MSSDVVGERTKMAGNKTKISFLRDIICEEQFMRVAKIHMISTEHSMESEIYVRNQILGFEIWKHRLRVEKKVYIYMMNFRAENVSTQIM